MIGLRLWYFVFFLDRTIKTLSKDEHNEASKAEPAKVDIAAEFNKVTDTNLFEPPGNNNKAEPQKFKKGNLKLTQDDKGNWKIEENLDQNAENNNKVTVWDLEFISPCIFYLN